MSSQTALANELKNLFNHLSNRNRDIEASLNKIITMVQGEAVGPSVSEEQTEQQTVEVKTPEQPPTVAQLQAANRLKLLARLMELNDRCVAIMEDIPRGTLVDEQHAHTYGKDNSGLRCSACVRLLQYFGVEDEEAHTCSMTDSQLRCFRLRYRDSLLIRFDETLSHIKKTFNSWRSMMDKRFSKPDIDVLATAVSSTQAKFSRVVFDRMLNIMLQALSKEEARVVHEYETTGLISAPSESFDSALGAMEFALTAAFTNCHQLLQARHCSRDVSEIQLRELRQHDPKDDRFERGVYAAAYLFNFIDSLGNGQPGTWMLEVGEVICELMRCVACATVASCGVPRECKVEETNIPETPSTCQNMTAFSKLQQNCTFYSQPGSTFAKAILSHGDLYPAQTWPEEFAKQVKEVMPDEKFPLSIMGSAAGMRKFFEAKAALGWDGLAESS